MEQIPVPEWVQWALLLAAFIGAVGVIWRKLILPSVQLVNAAHDVFPLIPILVELANEFGTNGSSVKRDIKELRDSVSKLQQCAHETRDEVKDLQSETRETRAVFESFEGYVHGRFHEIMNVMRTEGMTKEFIQELRRREGQ